MQGIDLSDKPAVLQTLDTFLAAVPWTKNRMVVVFMREHSGRRHVRLRTFNRHRTKGCWYPAPRWYTVPIEKAESLGQAIIEAAKGKSFGDQPDWWADFEEQYAALPKNRQYVSCRRDHNDEDPDSERN